MYHLSFPLSSNFSRSNQFQQIIQVLGILILDDIFSDKHQFFSHERHYEFYDRKALQGAEISIAILLLLSTSVLLGVVTCTCNPVTLETKFRNGAGSMQVGSYSSLIDGWIVLPPAIQH